MATTLTEKGELTVEHFSFPIEKIESTPDGDLMVYGKASDGTIDSDQQIVDPQWMAKAVQDWLSTGPNLRVQHNPQRDPAGIGLTAETDSSGATWVKSLVCEPVAKRLVSKGALRAYSVGIARPTISRDQSARGGRITDGTLVEISLVDRPANKSCGIQLVKSADDGSAEFIEKVFGDKDVIAKFAGADVIAKSDTTEDASFGDDMSLTFTPGDLAKILKNKIIDQHYEDLAVKALYEAEAEVYKRNVNTAERRSLASQGNTLSDGSYPIANAGDLHNAAHLAQTGHGNANAAKELIARRAKELGVSNPLDSGSDSEKGGSVAEATPEVVKDEQIVPEATEKEAEPEVTKDPADGDGPGPKGKKKGPKDGKGALPFNAGSPEEKAGSAEGGKAEVPEECKQEHEHTDKCHSSPTQVVHVDSPDAKPAPVKELLETPMPAGRKAEESAMLRLKSLGIDPDLGKLHDLTCPAYGPETAAAYHPYSSIKSLVDETYWQRMALNAAASRPLDEAVSAQKAWQAAVLLKGADDADLNDYRLEMHKAFRDANPGPSSYPTPGCVSPTSYNRPAITAGHASYSTSYGSPNSAPQVGREVNGASGFSRPPLSAGHESPSPSFMKNDFEYPQTTGMPTRLDYAVMEKERARTALSYMHDHLSRMFPMACPMDAQDPNAQPGSRDVNNGVGKAEEVAPEATEVIKTEAEETLQKELTAKIEKGRKKLMKKLGKKVMSGKMTLDQARGKMGNFAAMKTEDEVPVEKAEKLDAEVITESALKNISALQEVSPNVPKDEFTPDVMKTMMSEILEPFMAKISVQEEKLEAQQKALDAIADMPDPSTASFSGIALKTSRPVAVKSQAEFAEHAQAMIKRNLETTFSTHSNPTVREAAGEALNKMRGSESAF